MSLGYMLGAGMDGYMKGREWKEQKDERKEQRERKKKIDEQTQAVMDFLAAALGPPPNQAPAGQPQPPMAQQGLAGYIAGNR